MSKKYSTFKMTPAMQRKIESRPTGQCWQCREDATAWDVAVWEIRPVCERHARMGERLGHDVYRFDGEGS